MALPGNLNTNKNLSGNLKNNPGYLKTYSESRFIE
jgi:hypothetical protein